MLVNNFLYVNNNTDCRMRTNDIIKPDILCSKTANMAKMIPVMIKRILRIGVSLLNKFNFLFIGFFLLFHTAHRYLQCMNTYLYTSAITSTLIT